MTLNLRNKPRMLLKTKDREKLTRLEPRVFMKTNEIVELTWNAQKIKELYGVGVRKWIPACAGMTAMLLQNIKDLFTGAFGAGVQRSYPPKKRGTKPECPLASTKP